MIKRNVLTTVGIILSFVIAIGGWAVTSWLIDMESYRLLSSTRSFVVDMPTIESPVTNEENGSIRLGLTENEIVSILRNWELTDYRRPHEPAPGQIDMQTAIISGRAGLLFLPNQNILPAELMTFNNTGAFLSQNVPQGGEFLPLRYSYWTVSAANDDIYVRMTINAVTGQVWKIEINTVQRYAVMALLSASQDEILNLLAAFTSDLGIHTNQSPVTVWETAELRLEHTSARQINPWDTIIAYQNFADGNAVIIVDGTDTLFALEPDGELHFRRLNIYLTTQ